MSSLLKSLILIAIIWAAAVYGYEFRLAQRPSLSKAQLASVDTPAPLFGLANVTFACAASHGFVTGVQVTGTQASAECGSGFTEQTTHCPSGLPMSGYGEQIKCAQGEAIHCHGGPLQTVGLFKDDSFCGDVSDRDLGPPQESPRADD
jgi:hypothetical protein